MSDVEQRIQERVEAFVQELSVLVRQSVLDSVSDALGGGSSGAARGRGGRRPAGPAGAARAAGAARGRRRKGQKRSPRELERLVDSVRGYVQKHPGEGVEKMARELGTNSRELVLPLKKLIKQGEVRTRGEKRATKYFPGGGRGRKAKA
jgi:hypothetical protein